MFVYIYTAKFLLWVQYYLLKFLLKNTLLAVIILSFIRQDAEHR